MEQNVQQLLIKVNQSIIKIRGAYAACARQNQVNYHELLIFYSLRYLNACTQKQVCEQYLIRKQQYYCRPETEGLHCAASRKGGLAGESN